jgi:hypothetical protein
MKEPTTLLDMIEAEFAFLVDRDFHPTVESDNSVRTRMLTAYS